MEKINYYGIVPVGILAHLYDIMKHYDIQEGSMREIENQYNWVRHLLAINLIQAK